MSAPAEPIQYRRGMPYGEFLEMMAQRRAVADMPVDLLPEEECVHPYERLVTTIRGKRPPAGVPQVKIVVDYTCGECGSFLGHDRKAFRL